MRQPLHSDLLSWRSGKKGSAWEQDRDTNVEIRQVEHAGGKKEEGLGAGLRPEWMHCDMEALKQGKMVECLGAGLRSDAINQ